MRPWPEPGARKEEEAMKKLFALLMALTMTVQLVTPAWAEAAEDGPEETTEAVEVVEETTEATEETEVPEETEAETEETEATEEVTEPEETTEETAEAEPTEETEEALPEAGVVEDVAALEAGVVASGTCGENLSWILTEDGVLRISGNGAMPDYRTSSVAPWYSKRTKILSVVIEPGVTGVGSCAFYACLELAEVELPEGISYVGWGAFEDCTKLKAVEIPDGVTSIGSSAFSGCSSLTSVSIPDGVTSIEGDAFRDCSGLTSVSIPGGVTSIGGSAFSGCSGLTSVSIPEGVTSIGTQAFSGCSGLKRVYLPSSLREIRDEAFYGCSSLTSVTIPEGVESIHEFAFARCSELKALSIPQSVNFIEGGAFTGCERLRFITFLHDYGSLLTVEGGAFYLPNDQVPTTIQVPDAGKVNTAIKSYGWKNSGRNVTYVSNNGQTKAAIITIWDDRQRIYNSMDLDIADGTTLSLRAVIEPVDAIQKVKWSSSAPAVASVSETGKVTLRMPGTAVISATTVDGSKLSAKVTLNIIYLDKAKKLNLRSDAPAIGLQIGQRAQLTLLGSEEIPVESIDFSIPAEEADIASVDSNGIVTAGTMSGTATITAALKSDPLGRKAVLKLKVIPIQVQDLRVSVEDPESLGKFIQTDTESQFNLDMDIVAESDRCFPLAVESLDEGGNWTQTSQVRYTSSDSSIANVGTNGMLTVKKASSGECIIRIQSDDLKQKEILLRIVVEDKSPRLESNSLTLNSNMSSGASTGLMESYGNTVMSVAVYDYNKSAKRYEDTPSTSFAAEVANNTLAIRSLGAKRNGTYQLKLVVTCQIGIYTYTIQVKIANSLPNMTVKQHGKFNTFYLGSSAMLDIKAAGCRVVNLELIGANSFQVDDGGRILFSSNYEPGEKINAKGTLRVYLEGYQVPVEKAITIATVHKVPKVVLSPSSSVVNTALGEAECRVKVMVDGEVVSPSTVDYPWDLGFAEADGDGQNMVFRLTGTKGGTAKFPLRMSKWAEPVTVTHKITVENKLPTVKLGTPTLKLNSLFSAQTARTSVWLTQGNLDISTMDFKAAREEGKSIDLSFDPETDSIEAKFKEMPKAGTYSYTYTAYLENGTALPNGTIKVTVAATAPKVKLSAASIKLNRYLAGQEKATVKVTLAGGTGYQVTDFEELPDYMRYDAETSELTVVLPDETFTGKTCNLYPIVREEESGQEVKLPTKLTLKVQTLNTNKLTVSLSAKGKLNTVDPDSAIAYTVTKVNNCLGTVESVDLAGQDGDLFQVDLDTSGVKPLVLLRLLPGESYATNKTYKVRFRFTVCGREVLSSVLSVKVAQTALKVTAPKTAVYYLSQSGPLRCSLKANLPLESVALSARTAKEFQQALGGQENLRLIGNRVEFKLTNPGALTAGKSYSVQLELTPENAAENTKPTTIKLNVKVMK